MTIEEVRARLLPKFLAKARERVAGARAAIVASAPERVRDELHALAGDAAMIGQPEIAAAGRACLAAARQWAAGAAEARETCARDVATLGELIDALAARG